MANYIIAGGTGFIGQYLSQLIIEQQHDLFVLTTQINKVNEQGIQYIYWNPAKQYIDEAFQLSNAFIINLAGANVAEKRWTNERKKAIVSSRIDSLNTLFNACKSGQIDCKHLTSASAIGYYGNEQGICTENSLGDESYLSQTCQAWENATLQFHTLGIHTSIARVGIVLGKQAGALHEFIKPLRFGLAGIPSNGKQIYSWISLHDVANLLFYLTFTQTLGIFNAVAPNPCSIQEIFTELKKQYRVFATIHTPTWLLNILLGEMAIEVLKSTTVSSEKIQNTNFKFKHQTILQCLHDEFKK
jgi:uncharacterized protein